MVISRLGTEDDMTLWDKPAGCLKAFINMKVIGGGGGALAIDNPAVTD